MSLDSFLKWLKSVRAFLSRHSFKISFFTTNFQPFIVGFTGGVSVIGLIVVVAGAVVYRMKVGK